MTLIEEIVIFDRLIGTCDELIGPEMLGATRINLKHLRAFRAVAENQHFTRAAEEIGLSQPALSALIAQLEEDLSVQLFNRTTRAVQLTPAGREFLVAAARILGDVASAILDARGHAQLRRGRLRIAALPSVCDGFLPGLIRCFHEQHEGIAITILDLPADEIVGAAMAGQVDFGIGHVVANDDQGFEPILTDRLVAVASRSLVPDASHAISWRQLTDHDVIAMAQGTSVRRLIDAGAHQAKTELRVLLEPRQMPAAIAYARAGLGIAILPSTGVRPDLGPDMAVMAVVEPVIERTLSIIRAGDAALSPPAQRFLKMLREHVIAR